MKRKLFFLALLAASSGCVKEHKCREGTVFVTVQFVDTNDQVNGLALSYFLGNSDTPIPLFPVNSPLARPSGGDQGGFELQIANYTGYQSLTLQYIPTKDTIPIGDWQNNTITLDPGCSTSTLQVQIKTSGGAEIGAIWGPDSGAIDAPPAQQPDGARVISRDSGIAPDRMDAPLSERDALPSAPDRSADTLDAPAPERDVPQMAPDSGAGTQDATRNADASGGSGESRDGAVSVDCNTEQPPTNDPMNCGACGHKCAPGERCGAGHCCPIGSAWCPTDGGYACMDITYDPANCGSCGSICNSVGKECCGGQCLSTSSYRSDPNNCGVCGNFCDDPGDDSSACLIFDQCKKASCGDNGKGAIICNPQASGGCEFCPAGCCKDSKCLQGTQNSACGSSGAACQDCSKVCQTCGGGTCQGGECACSDPFCGFI
jgi:hypothetical protein